ncbi:uncharacterized protein LOC143550386 [Bidens hawaiensis]|uniref:uncharacterized protein LOC143550386 n=1 Tax=Bidens hawaiensis TaxID=980011 RepID=UPI00404A9DAB
MFEKGHREVFWVLRQRWHHVKNLCRAWTLEKMRDAMYTCIILHNMVIEDEERAIWQHYIPKNFQQQTQATMGKKVQNAYQIRSSEIHNSLMADLVQHAWSFRPIRGEGENVSSEDYEGYEES